MMINFLRIFRISIPADFVVISDVVGINKQYLDSATSFIVKTINSLIDIF